MKAPHFISISAVKSHIVEEKLKLTEKLEMYHSFSIPAKWLLFDIHFKDMKGEPTVVRIHQVVLNL